MEYSPQIVKYGAVLSSTQLYSASSWPCIFSSTPDGEVSRDKKVDERRGSEFGKIRFCAAYQTYWTRKTNFYFNFKVLLPLLTIHKSIFASCRNHIEMPKKLPH